MKKVIVILGLLLFSLGSSQTAHAYSLLSWWHTGSGRIMRYNQLGTKHSLQVAHADIHWNNQIPGTIQRNDYKASVYIYDYYSKSDGVGGITYPYVGRIEVNDYWMIRSNHPSNIEYSFTIMTHEFGHAMGIAHGGKKTIMYYTFMQTPLVNVPTSDDKAALIASKRRWIG